MKCGPVSDRRTEVAHNVWCGCKRRHLSEEPYKVLIKSDEFFSGQRKQADGRRARHASKHSVSVKHPVARWRTSCKAGGGRVRRKFVPRRSALCRSKADLGVRLLRFVLQRPQQTELLWAELEPHRFQQESRTETSMSHFNYRLET